MVRPVLIAAICAGCGGAPAARPAERALPTSPDMSEPAATPEHICRAVEASVTCAPGALRTTELGPVSEEGSLFCLVTCAPSGEVARVNVSTGGYEQRGQVLDGRREGVWRVWETDENLARRLVTEETYGDDLRDGPLRRWYRSGQLREEATYREDRLHGVRREYSPTGVVIGEGEYLEGMSVGVHRERHLNGQIAAERHYDAAGLPDGRWCFYRSDGSLSGCSDFENGTGLLAEYDRAGGLIREVAMRDGERHGRYVEYLADGARYESEFREGAEHGVGRRIRQDGCVERELTYVDGQPNGPFVERNCAEAPPIVTLEGQHCAGLNCGRWIERDPSTGRKTAEYQYSPDGELLGTVTYDADEQVREFTGDGAP